MVYKTADGFGVTYARLGGGSSNAIGMLPVGERRSNPRRAIHQW